MFLRGKVECRIVAAAALIAMMIMMAGCGISSGGNADDPADSQLKPQGSLELKYATQYSVNNLEGGCYEVKIEDGLKYILVPKGAEAPAGADADHTVINIPAENIYLSASSAMDMFRQLDSLDNILFTSTDEWEIDGISERLESGQLIYIGKYSAPDYEALMEGDSSLAIESTMIYHTPKVKEEIEGLGIPVLVERSSYESDPLGRLEWIKLYGLLTGKEKEAVEYFDEVEAELKETLKDVDANKDKPSVAFFSISDSGHAVIRKPGDYVTKMIEMAGGEYAFADIVPEDENALSTMNIQLESFFDAASDADILIYNSTIHGDLKDINALTEKSALFKDLKAVKEGRVWCTNKNVFQETTGVSGMVTELYGIISGNYDESRMEYFHRLND